MTNHKLKKLLKEPVSDIFDFHKRLIRIVKAVLQTDNVRPGFQHHPIFVQFEREVSFNTGEAIAAFARQANESLTKKQKSQQTIIIRRLIEKIVTEAAGHELMRQCFDVSNVVGMLLEKLDIWAVCYLGTLRYDGNGKCENAAFYYVDDLHNPPENSAARGHSWIFTPAFPVLDLTAKYQPLNRFLNEHTPFPVLVENEVSNFTPRHNWYIDQRDSEQSKAIKQRILDEANMYPDWNRFHKVVLCQGIISLEYIPMSLVFFDKPDEVLEARLLFGGKTAALFLQEFVAANGSVISQQGNQDE